jgi:TPR repeat protein
MTRLALAIVSIGMSLSAWPAMAADFATGERLYSTGDFAGARDEFRVLTDRGHAGAEFMTGIMFLNGQSYGRDPRTAAAWFHRAAQKGDPGAQLVFGSQRLYGQGVSANPEDAYLWLSLAAKTSNAEIAGQAQRFLSIASAKLTTAEIERADRAARNWRPRPAGFVRGL